MDTFSMVVYAVFVVLGIGAMLWARRSISEDATLTPNAIAPGLASVPDSRPRGIRNNNPTNIEDSGIKWQGRIGNDGRYVVFDSAVKGLRAGFLEIYDSITNDGDNTIRALIRQWAPPIENLTGAYQYSVANQTGLGIDQILSYSTHAHKLLRAIVQHENGQNPYTSAQYDQAFREAGKR